MRIGIFANSYLPVMYGSITSVENFRIGLERLGHEVYLFVPNYKGYEYKNPRIILYPGIMYGYRIKYPLPFTWYPPIWKKAKELKLDIVHAQQPFSVGRDGLRVAKGLNAPLVFTHHARYDDYTHFIPPLLPQELIKKIIRGKVSRFANKCNRVIAPSNSIVDYIKENNISSRISVLSTGIDWNKFQSGKRAETREKHGISRSAKVLLYLGRIDKEKDAMFLAETTFPLLKKDQNLRFVFVGEGSTVSEIKKYSEKLGVQERVLFTGLVDQTEVQDYYAAADIFVHASRTETQGMTITEAMASGLAVVAVEGTGVSDQIENGKTGILTRLDKEQFTQSIKGLLDNREECLKIGEAAREKAREMDFLSKATELEKIYLEEIKRHKKQS